MPVCAWLKPWVGTCDKCQACKACKACIVRCKSCTPDATWEAVWPEGSIPRAFILPSVPPPNDQEAMAACAVNACATAASYAMEQSGHKNVHVSRLFLYYNTRRYVMHVAKLTRDTGCCLKDVCKAAVTMGVCDEALWPYKKNLLGCEPPVQVYIAAQGMPRLSSFRVRQVLADMVSCLLNNHPIMMGMSVFTNISDAAKNGVMTMPTEQDTHLGDHAVLVCGYDLDTRTFTLLNCWGETWGNHGFFEVPMAFALNRRFCWDLWMFSCE